LSSPTSTSVRSRTGALEPTPLSGTEYWLISTTSR
jgi:hypothetical protein